MGRKRLFWRWLIVLILVAGSIFLITGCNSTNRFWAKSYGGTDYERACSIQQIANNGYIVTGATESFGAGKCDIWILKLNNDGTVSPLGANTNVTPVNTSIAPFNTTATDANTFVAGINSSAIVHNTSAIINQQAP